MADGAPRRPVPRLDRPQPAHGKAGRAAWRKARAALPAASGKKTETVLRAFVATFGKLDDEHSIDTADREELMAAFHALAAAAGVETQLADRWFSDWCDF